LQRDIVTVVDVSPIIGRNKQTNNEKRRRREGKVGTMIWSIFFFMMNR